VAVCRELTKKFQEYFRGTIADAVEWADRGPKGEMVLVVGGAPERVPTEDEITAAVRSALATGRSRRDAAEEVAADLGVSRRLVYELSLAADSAEQGT